jgi:hypothetical protein
MLGIGSSIERIGKVAGAKVVFCKMQMTLRTSHHKLVAIIICAIICLPGCGLEPRRLSSNIPTPVSNSPDSPLKEPLAEAPLPNTTPPAQTACKDGCHTDPERVPIPSSAPKASKASPHHKFYKSKGLVQNKSAQNISTLTTKNTTPYQKAKESAAYYIPSTMVEKVTSEVYLWINSTVPLNQLKAQLLASLLKDAKSTEARFGHLEDKDIKGEAQVVGREIHIGSYMSAELRGIDSNFEITPKGKITHPYTGGTLPWSWQVVPLRASKNRNDLLPLQIIVESSDGLPPENEINEKVMVMVEAIELSTYQKIKKAFEELDWWSKILGSILGGGGIGAFALWMYKKVTRRSRSNEPA